jgi:hypothetical protein
MGRILGYLGRDGADCRPLAAAQTEDGSTNVQGGKAGVQLLQFSTPKRKFRLVGSGVRVACCAGCTPPRS